MELVAGDDRGLFGLDQADLPGHGAGGLGMVTGDHDHADPGGTAARNRIGDLGPGRVIQPDQASECQVVLQLGVVVPSATGRYASARTRSPPSAIAP